MRERIREAIAAAGTTANRASVALGWDRGYVGKLGTVQAGKVPEPGALKLKLLARYLGVPSSWFVDAIDPDAAERARGVKWPPPDSSHVEVSPKPGQFIENRDELALLAFWRPLGKDKQRFMLDLLRNGALGATMDSEAS